jgi:hypothetical protein
MAIFLPAFLDMRHWMPDEIIEKFGEPGYDRDVSFFGRHFIWSLLPELYLEERRHECTTIPKSKIVSEVPPYEHPQMPQMFAAMVGFVLDEYIVSPRMVDLTVTPDGFPLARAEGEVSPVSVGRHESWT